MHPLILFDANKEGDLELCEKFGADILRLCVEAGGCLTGEHGVGIEKRDLMGVQYAPDDLEAQMAVKDVFDPAWLLNAAKVFPLAVSEPRRGRAIAAELSFGALPRTPGFFNHLEDRRDDMAVKINSEAALAEAVQGARGPLAVVGGGTRGFAGMGEVLSVAGLSGVTLYEPGAMTMVAQAGTPVAVIEKALAKQKQRLAFEPVDHRGLLGTRGKPTIGGVFAANVSGPRRIAVGAARDFLLGVRFVDGQGRSKCCRGPRLRPLW
jgi:FAD/FMN-containing dehydrogenase